MANIAVAGYIGNVNIDKTDDGSTRLSASIADNYKHKRDSETTWYSFTLFGKYADTMKGYISKGKYFMVSGNLVPNVYQTREGETRIGLNIYNPSLVFGPKSEGHAEASVEDDPWE